MAHFKFCIQTLQLDEGKKSVWRIVFISRGLEKIMYFFYYIWFLNALFRENLQGLLWRQYLFNFKNNLCESLLSGHLLNTTWHKGFLKISRFKIIICHVQIFNIWRTLPCKVYYKTWIGGYWCLEVSDGQERWIHRFTLERWFFLKQIKVSL